MPRYVIDSFAWIEYFRGSQKGAEAKIIIEDKRNEIITNVITVSEVVSVISRQARDPAEAYEQLLVHSKIFHFDAEFAKNVGILHAGIKKNIKDFGLADAFVLETARKAEAKVLTGDPHFRSFKESVML